MTFIFRVTFVGSLCDLDLRNCGGDGGVLKVSENSRKFMKNETRRGWCVNEKLLGEQTSIFCIFAAHTPKKNGEKLARKLT
jgi:hypothetical protein